MLTVLRLAVFLALSSLSVGIALACTMPPKARPTILEETSEGGNYVMVVVESPERYRNLGYEPTAQDQALLDKYTVSGVYRVGGSTEQPVWPISDRMSARWFFEEGDSVYWIDTSVKPFRVWKDGELIGGPDWKDAVGWFRAPWTWREQCGGYPLYELEMTSGDAGRAIKLRTVEGTEFLYGATTGDEIKASVPQTLPPQPATGSENEIAQIVARWSQFAEARAYEDLSSDFSKHNAEIVVESCEDLEQVEGLGGPEWMERQGLFPAGPEIRASQTDIFIAPRLRHELDERVDLYRISTGDAGKALCLGEFWLPSSPYPRFIHQYGVAGARQKMDELRSRLEGPTVLASTTWPVPEASDFTEEEEIGALGSATLWSETEEGWRIVAFVKFVLPRE